MFRWAGVDNVNPASRGPFIDARELAFLEKMIGEPFLQVNRYLNPAPMAATLMKDAFQRMFNHVYAELLAPAAGRVLFVLRPDGILSPKTMQALGAHARKLPDGKKRLALWQIVVRLLPWNVFGQMSRADVALIEREMKASGLAMTLKAVHASLNPYDDDYKNGRWRHRDGHIIAFNILYKKDMSHRIICYQRVPQ